MEKAEIFDLSFVIKTWAKITKTNQSVIGGNILNCLYCPEDGKAIVFSESYISKIVNHKKPLDKRIINFVKEKENKTKIENEVRELIFKKLLKAVETIRYSIYKSFYDVIICDTYASENNKTTVRRLKSHYNKEEYFSFLVDALIFSALRYNIEEPKELEFLYLKEVNYQCPCCGRMLIRNSGNTGHNLSEVIQIYPQDAKKEIKEIFTELKFHPKDLSSPENHIALCKPDAEKYKNDPTESLIKKVVYFKKNLQRIRSINDIVVQNNLSDKIMCVIRELKLNPRKFIAISPEDIDLPASVEEKILPGNYFLREKIMFYAKYYKEIEQYFALSDSNYSVASFETIRAEVNLLYRKISDQERDQIQIFDDMCKVFIKNNDPGINISIPGEIVLSFFVRNCAVF